MVLQQKTNKLADRSSALSFSGIKCKEVVFKMFVNAQNIRYHNTAKVIFQKTPIIICAAVSVQQCGFWQPPCNPMLPVGHHLGQGCCKIHSAKDTVDKHRMYEEALKAEFVMQKSLLPTPELHSLLSGSSIG